MIVLGIDPGLSATGYGIIERTGNRITPLNWGVIRSSKETLPVRLKKIYNKLNTIIEEYSPDIVAIEDIYTGRNPRSGLRLGHARGVAILAAAQSDYPVKEYPAATVKQAVVGHGRASKQQVGFMVRKLLNLGEAKIAEDAADALAVAICCLFREKNVLK
ncbi:MAG: crossover junction endodeoxyribonuclease RuvC [Candidatus Hatepunaea meridiana]|nr:crossover junction endodeoxyribonuclease RuvC [Candidatus Hatepunaea meridiana]